MEDDKIDKRAKFTFWDFTISAENDRKLVVDFLRMFCLKWTFQLEEGASGYFHYQGRLKLKIKDRVTALVTKCRNAGMSGSVKFSVTSSGCTDTEHYVIKKDETYRDGPWRHDDPIDERHIPVDLLETICKYGMNSFQKEIHDSFKMKERREINVVIETNGNVGKSILCKYLGVFGIAHKIACVNDYKDIMRSVLDRGKIGGYFLDMPKACKREKLAQMYMALEEIKGGYAYDDRYSYREEYFDPPVIWVFTNTQPDLSLLSADRWRMWTVVESGKMEGCPEMPDYHLKPFIPVYKKFTDFEPEEDAEEKKRREERIKNTLRAFIEQGKNN